MEKLLDVIKTMGLVLGMVIPLAYKEIQYKKKNCILMNLLEKASYNFYGDKNALSEDDKGIRIFASEIEVFQVIFES